ncbi:MAG: hypothetical protein AB7G76_03240 [Steroidobacteraceae bacterium]
MFISITCPTPRKTASTKARREYAAAASLKMRPVDENRIAMERESSQRLRELNRIRNRFTSTGSGSIQRIGIGIGIGICP